MKEEMKPTKSEWTVCEHSWSDTSVFDAAGNLVCSLSIDDEDTTEDSQEEREKDMSKRARFIAEAGTVYHETGLTPREVLAQRDELRTALSGLIANFKANGGKGLGLGPVQIAKTALKNTTPEPQP